MTRKQLKNKFIDRHGELEERIGPEESPNIYALADFYNFLIDAYEIGISNRMDTAFYISQTLNYKAPFVKEITELADAFDNPESWIPHFLIGGTPEEKWAELVYKIRLLRYIDIVNNKDSLTIKQ